MELDAGSIDPEVRAYVYSLVSALGGTGADENGLYILGDDALACLKDLKKWLKLHDEKSNRLDVARCLAEANLVKGDILEILASWPEEATEDKFKSKVALACLELLVPLTWPIEKNDMQMTVNHHRHIPYLQLSQISYKKAILEHGSTSILRTCLRIGLPSIALPMGERTPRDEGIIKLLLYFYRNMAMITLPNKMHGCGDEGEISRSATIEAFHHQDVLALILTIASNMGEDFNTQDTVILEVLFHLLKGVDVVAVYASPKHIHERGHDELGSLLAREADMHRGYAKHAPSRHNRFGTMIWVQRDGEGRHSTVSGQDVLKDKQKTLSKMDQTKKWNKPRPQAKDNEQTYDRFDMPVPLNTTAKGYLRLFVDEFLDSSFNPLFNHLRRAIEREADRVLETHRQQYFYLISWFLEAERTRRLMRKAAGKSSREKKIDETFEADSFALIATVLTQESFVLMNRYMQEHLDTKAWREVHAGIRCFTQTLLIVQDMTASSVEEDQEIAENILNRIFYEETTHDRIIAILRSYKDQGFGYLDSCTELSHVFLRMLERYSREHIDLQIRSRRRARKSRKAAARQDDADENEDEGSELEDTKEAERTTRERQFDFMKFSSKFMTQACVNTFVAFTQFYSDLTDEQLKRAHRFFYRLAFKQDLSVILFRLDIIALFNKMIQGPERLNSKSPNFREWDEFVRQIIKRLTRKLQQRPELAIELLFSKINATTFFLEHGYEKQTIEKTVRPPAVLEVKGKMSIEEQLGVVVAVLHEDHIDYIDWVIHILASAVDERQSWEAEATVRRETELDGMTEEDPNKTNLADPKPPSISIVPTNDDIRTALFKNAKLRLLMTLSGFLRLGADDETDATWMVPSTLTSGNLIHTKDCIAQHRTHPVFQYGDEDSPMLADELLRRKPIQRNTGMFEESDDLTDGEEEFMFPAGGPTNSVDKKASALESLKKSRRKRNRIIDEDSLDDEALEARRRAREEADLEKRRKIKSAEFVRDSDDEDDAERDRAFFAREARLRAGQQGKVLEVLAEGRIKKPLNSKAARRKADGASSKKRKGGVHDDARDKADKTRKMRTDIEQSSSEDDDMDVGHDLSSPGFSRHRKRMAKRDETVTSNDSGDENPRITDSRDAPLASRSKKGKSTDLSAILNDSDIENEQSSSTPPARFKPSALESSAESDIEGETPSSSPPAVSRAPEATVEAKDLDQDNASSPEETSGKEIAEGFGSSRRLSQEKDSVLKRQVGRRRRAVFLDSDED